MKKSLKYVAMGLGIMSLVPLAGNAYYCSKTKTAHSVHAQNTEEHKTKDIKDIDVLTSLNIKAKSIVLMEKNSGKILLKNNETQKLPMASMTKMMTMLLLMEEIDAKRIDLNQTTYISEYAASQEGSECFLDANKPYKVKDLLKSIVVASANDSSVAIAELVSGSEAMFAKKMNEKAKMLNMINTNYVNATGLDAEGHYSTAEDMCKVMRELSKYDIIKHLSKTWLYDMEHAEGRVTSLTNTNRLLKTNPDCALAKTGHTDGAGYCITVLGERDNMELIACVMGEAESKDRFEDATKLLNFGFTNYESKQVVDDDEVVSSIKVKGGKIKELQVYPKTDLYVLVLKGDENKEEVKLNLPSAVDAPLKEGQTIGEICVILNNEEVKTDLVVRENIEEKNIKDYMKELM